MKDCKSMSKCTRCGGRHHVAICRTPNEKPVQHNADGDECKKEVGKDGIVLLSNSSSSRNATIMLQSASIRIEYASKKVPSRVLFDSGSQRTFISRELASKLGCEAICKERMCISSFGASQGNISDMDLVAIGLESSQEVFNVEALVVDTISFPVPMKI